MKTYLIYGKAKNTIYSIVNRGLEDARLKAEALKKIIKGEEFYIVETGQNHPTLNWSDTNTDEFLKNAIRVN